MNMDMKITVIGPSQSGKTCLAAGLANSKSNELTVNPRGDVTREHLAKLEKAFAQSEWPGSTHASKTLRFEFTWKAESVEAIFTDYKGEASTKIDFLEKISKLGKNDGVILLVNPGFKCPYVEEAGGPRIASEEDEKAKKPIKYVEAFKDNRPFVQQWLIDLQGTYAKIIERLRASKEQDLPVVAVVVTASDRLEQTGDLYKVQSRFEEFLGKITNMLSEFKVTHEPFRVSVTGHLADQNKPALAVGNENTSYKPFSWVIEQLVERRNKADQEAEDRNIAAYRQEIQAKRKKSLKILATIAVGIGLCGGAYEWVEADRDQKNIANWRFACISSLSKPSLCSANIKKAAGYLNLLRRHNGFHAAKAVNAADQLEQEIWKKQNFLISRYIREISDSQGSKGGINDIAEVGNLLSAFKPTLANVAAEYNKVCVNWNRQKVELAESHNEYEFREKVEKPLRATEMFHGISAMDKLYPITDTISSLKPSTKRLSMAKEELARKVDERIAAEWRNFAMHGFTKIASTNATTKAVLAFQARLDAWTPVSSYGIAEKSNLVASVSAQVLIWRTQYETTKFIGEADEAVKNNSMEKMAMLYPGRVATNEFLTTEFVGEQWKRRVKPAFERERTAFLDGFVAKSSNGRGRPVLAADDKNTIQRRATEVGAPFDSDDALKYVEEHVMTKAQTWDSEKRGECEKWIKEKIRQGRSRTDRKGLWSEYEKDPIRRSNPFFIEIVGTAVYREVEKWFESDIAAFKKELAPTEGASLWQDDSNFEVRYRGLVNTFEEFKKTCRRINEDKNPPANTWAHRFAELCVTKGGIESGGVNKVFGQRISAKQLSAMMDYKKKFPVNYKCTAFAAWFEVESFEGDGSPEKRDDGLSKVTEFLISVDGDNAPKNEMTSIEKEREGKFKEIWSGEKILEVGLFQRTKFVVRVTDYNGNQIKKTSDIKKVVSFVDQQQTLELDGQLHIGRWTGIKDADIRVRLVADISGETPFSLLEQVKREMHGSGEAK